MSLVVLPGAMLRICRLVLRAVQAPAKAYLYHCHAVQARVNMMMSSQSTNRHRSSWLSAQRPLSCSRSPICRAAKSERPSPGNDPRMAPTEQTVAPPDPNLKVVELKDADVEGVAKVDSDLWQSDAGARRPTISRQSQCILCRKATVMPAGQSNHTGLISMDVLTIAMPFWASWYGAGLLTNAYGKDAQDGYVVPAALTAAKTWAVAAPLGLVFRSILKGYPAPVPFIIDQLTALERFQKHRSKKGNASEFMGLLQSLTKRW